jgi:very-long-chain (3R)-3-hydroxyacyl-CoA dehydratase
MNASIEKYLKAYNLIQLAGWMVAFVLLWLNFSLGFQLLWLFQIYALAEIYHAYRKWVQASPMLSFVQIGARIFILFISYALLLSAVFQPVPWLNEIVRIMLAAWCVAEIIRYGYYAMNLFGKAYKWLIKSRYSAFLVLYPLGAACECYLLFLVYQRETILWIKILFVAVAVMYVVMFPKLYLHLLKQRKKKLTSL